MREDESLKDHLDRTIIYRPVIIVERIEDQKLIYRLHLTEVDEMANDPRVFGIVLSDLVDHLARAYHDSTGRDARDVRAEIIKIMHDEDRFKEKDPTRCNLRGITIKSQPQ